MHMVVCKYCGKKFDRDKVGPNGYKIVGTRYAHLECYVQNNANMTVDDKGKMDLLSYIQNLFGDRINGPLVNRQITNYKNDYGYTYTSMLSCLKYAYEIKKEDINKAKGVGVIPIIYKEAYDYYYNLWLIEQKNKDKKIINENKPKEVIVIPPPVSKPRKKEFFSFLDEVEDNE